MHPILASFSLATLPKAVLYGVPAVLALAVGGAIYYEVDKSKKATAAAAALAAAQQQQQAAQLAAAQQQAAAAAQAAAKAPVSASAPAAAALTPGMRMINGKMTWVMSSDTAANAAFFQAVNAQTAAAKAAASGGSAPSPPPLLQQAQQQAQQLLASFPSPLPNDTMGLYRQVVAATLNQFIATPTASQLSTTLTDLQQAATGMGAPANAPILNVYNTLNRINQTMQA